MASLLLVLATLVSKAFAVVRDVLVAKHFGAGTAVDAFQVGLSLASVLGAGTGVALATAFLPHYVRISARSGADATRFASQVVWLALGGAVVLASCVAAFPGIVVKAGAPHLPEATFVAASDILRVMGLLIVALILTYVLNSIYHALHHFRTPVLVDLLSQVCVVASLYFFAAASGIGSLVWGLVVGVAVTVVLQAVLLARGGYFQWGGGLARADLKAFLVSLAPILLCDYATQAQSITQNIMSSGLPVGTIACLGYAGSLRNSLIALVALNVARGAFPRISQLVSESRPEELRGLVRRILGYLILGLVPISAFCALNSVSIVRVMFMRGRFDEDAVQSTALAFSIFSWGLLPNGVIPILLRVCFASGRTWAALAAMASGLAAFFVLSGTVLAGRGLTGIAIAATAAPIASVLGLGWAVRKRLGGIGLGSLARTTGAACLIAVVSALPSMALPAGGLPALLGSAAVFGALCAGLSYLVLRKGLLGLPPERLLDR